MEPVQPKDPVLDAVKEQFAPNDHAQPDIQRFQKPAFNFMGLIIPKNPIVFMEWYGWYFLIAFIFYYFFWDTLKEKILGSFPTSKKDDISRIPTESDMRLHEIRAKQQQRLDKITKINLEKKQYETQDDDKPKEIKLTKEQKKVKDSAAYRYLTTGKFGKDDKGGSGGLADSREMPRYRPNTPFQRYGRRPGGGGG